LDVVAANFVIPTADEIPAWDDVVEVEATMLKRFPLRKRFWGNDVAVDAASEVAADGTDFVFPPQIRLWLGE
jgi:hypothetical protein